MAILLVASSGVVDRAADRPLYQQITDRLREQIAAGALPGGESLPPKAVLARRFDVGPDTVADALAVLTNEGLIDCVRGRPALVRRQLPHAVLSVGGEVVIGARMPTAAERRQFELSVGIPVLVVRDAASVHVYPADRVELSPHASCPYIVRRLFRTNARLPRRAAVEVAERPIDTGSGVPAWPSQCGTALHNHNSFKYATLHHQARAAQRADHMLALLDAAAGGMTAAELSCNRDDVPKMFAGTPPTCCRLIRV